MSISIILTVLVCAYSDEHATPLELGVQAARDSLHAFDASGWSVDKKFELVRFVPNDPAMGNDYFPPGRSAHAKGSARRAAGMRFAWSEKSACRDGTYLLDMIVEGVEPGRSYHFMKLWDGEQSFVSSGTGSNERNMILQHDGLAPSAKLGDDYFRDMIGFPQYHIELPLRNISGDQPGERYRLVDIVVKGNYRRANDEIVNGFDCVVLEHDGIDKLWLAVSSNYMIVKREWRWTRNGPLKRAIHCSGSTPVDQFLFLPTRIRMEIYGHPSKRPNQVVGELICEITGFETSWSSTQEVRSFPNGSRILNTANGAIFVAGEESSRFESLLNKAKAESTMWKPEDRFATRYIVLASVLIASSAVLILRKWRAK